MLVSELRSCEELGDKVQPVFSIKVVHDVMETSSRTQTIHHQKKSTEQVSVVTLVDILLQLLRDKLDRDVACVGGESCSYLSFHICIGRARWPRTALTCKGLVAVATGACRIRAARSDGLFNFFSLRSGVWHERGRVHLCRYRLCCRFEVKVLRQDGGKES